MLGRSFFSIMLLMQGAPVSAEVHQMSVVLEKLKAKEAELELLGEKLNSRRTDAASNGKMPGGDNKPKEDMSEKVMPIISALTGMAEEDAIRLLMAMDEQISAYIVSQMPDEKVASLLAVADPEWVYEITIRMMND